MQYFYNLLLNLVDKLYLFQDANRNVAMKYLWIIWSMQPFDPENVNNGPHLWIFVVDFDSEIIPAQANADIKVPGTVTS